MWDTYQPGGLIFCCQVFFFFFFSFLTFLTVHGVLEVRILKWFTIPFSNGSHFVRLSTMTHPSLVALYSMLWSFTELHKAMIHVIILVGFLWLWFSFCEIKVLMPSVCPLMDASERLLQTSQWEGLAIGKTGNRWIYSHDHYIYYYG